jgi:hypothetical protein
MLYLARDGLAGGFDQIAGYRMMASLTVYSAKAVAKL